MAYGNQRLGGLADLTSVLDSLHRIEREETRSKERIAMQNIREASQTKRQDIRDERAYSQQKERDVYIHNKEMLSKYSEDDVTTDKEGFYVPKSGTLTYEKKAERVANIEDALGVHGIDYGGDLYSAYRTSIQRGAAFGEDLEYKGDESPGVLTVHDIDEIEEKIIQDAKKEYGGLEGIDWEGFSRGVKTGIAGNKGILSADKYQDYLKSKGYTSKTAAGIKDEQYEEEEDHIYLQYTSPIYSSLFKDSELGMVKTDLHKEREKEFLAQVGDGIIGQQYKRAMHDIWGDPQATDRHIIESFIKWDKQGRSASDRSIAEDLFIQFGLETQYKSMKRLVTEGDQSGKIDNDRLQYHFDKAIPQRNKIDTWSLNYPTLTGIFDQAVKEGSISLDSEYFINAKGEKDETLIINVNDEARWDDWMDTINDASDEKSDSFNQRTADEFKTLLDEIGQQSLRIE